MSRRSKSFSEVNSDLRSKYGSSQRSRLRKDRNIPVMGASGDYHLPGNDYLRVMEYARAIDRDDYILPSILTRAEINTVQYGPGLEIDTGDITLDEELLGGWCEWSENRDRCDVAGEMTFAEMVSMAFRQSQVDGDIWGLLLDSQQIQWFEADRLRTPPNAGDRFISQGVELDSNRKQLSVFLTPQSIGPYYQSFKPGELQQRAVRDDDGLRRMLQITAGPKRPTLTRGMSIYQNLLDLSGMHDDTQFAAILKQQLQNMVIFTEKMLPGDFGPPTNVGTPDPANTVPITNPDGTTGTTTEQVENAGPGVVVRNVNGRELEASRNTAPGPDFVSHVKMILTLMGVNLGMPLVLCLMDAKETNFSGWRGAFDQAKMGFRRNQNRLRQALLDPVLAWHLMGRKESDSSIGRRMDAIIAKAKAAGRQWYKWQMPTWPYVNPMEDASANLIAVANYQESPSTNMGKQGLDHDREMKRGIEDRDYCMRLAMAKAEAINAAFPTAKPQASWQDYYTPLAPKHVTIAVSEMRQVDEPPAPAPAGNKSNGA